ncbi:MAG: patatin-like phospholipase family protein, partial [Gammaproteobacteria bacterium]|nr:patatin-like phospholipase family protein [Gammaproteobacteria bacterium]
MLTPQPAIRPRRGTRIGLAMAGGGPLGAFFELGTLQALAESIEGLELDNLQAYVGVSSGAILAASLANGLSPVEMGRIILTNESGEFPVTPGVFLHPAYREYLARLASIPGLLARALGYYARAPLSRNVAEVLEPLTAVLPTGLFDGRPFEKTLRYLFSKRGRTNDFRDLKRKLFVVATDLNTGEAARFGEPGMDHVPISLAIQASTALPGLYQPVTIDGSTYVDGALLRTMHASLALDAGCDLVLCINPLVSYNASRGGTRPHHADLTLGGLPVVLSQTFRSMIQSRMQVGMAAYEERYPHADLLLFEPDRDDETMFFANVFRYADRRRVVEYAYQHARRDLRGRADAIGPLLARHGLSLRR